MSTEIRTVVESPDGPPQIKIYTGRRTVRAIRAQLARIRCGGERRAHVEFDRTRIADAEIPRALADCGEVLCEGLPIRRPAAGGRHVSKRRKLSASPAQWARWEAAAAADLESDSWADWARQTLDRGAQ